MTVTEIVRNIIEKRGIKIKKFASEIGMSEKGTHNIFKIGDIKISTLENIARVLEVDICVFFDKPKEYSIKKEGGGVNEPNVPYGRDAVINSLKNENKLLKDKVKDKEEIIKLLNNK